MTDDYEASDSADGGPSLGEIAIRLDELTGVRPTARVAAELSPKGARTYRVVIEAAHRVFVRDGHAGLSMRKVADEAGVALGNVNYYFGSKSALLDAMLREALADYIEAHRAHVADDGRTPADVLLDVVEFYIDNARASHPLFFQMWGYAASDPAAKALVRELYLPIGRFIHLLVKAARPDASEARVREIVLQLFSLEEGLKLFIGMGPDDAPAIATAKDHVRALARHIIMAD